MTSTLELLRYRPQLTSSVLEFGFLIAKKKSCPIISDILGSNAFKYGFSLVSSSENLVSLYYSVAFSLFPWVCYIF